VQHRHSHLVRIVYTRNTRHLLPPQAPRAARELRLRLRTPLVLHASKKWLSVKIFGHISREKTVRTVSRILGGPIAYREEEPPTGNPGLLTRCFLGYVKANMFWEAHVAGEAIWARIGLVGRALAVAAGALARTQEGSPEPARKMIEKAKLWLMQEGVEIDAGAAGEAIRRLYREGWVDATPLLAPAVREAARRLGEPPPL
jgi:hypothetical protein